MFYISFTQLVLERNGVLSYEVDLIKAPKSFDVHAMQQMRYHQDNKDEYYYQDEFCMIYEDRFIFYEKVPMNTFSAKPLPHLPLPLPIVWLMLMKGKSAKKLLDQDNSIKLFMERRFSLKLKSEKIGWLLYWPCWRKLWTLMVQVYLWVFLIFQKMIVSPLTSLDFACIEFHLILL